MKPIDRRQFLQLAAMGGATFALGRYAAFAAEQGKPIRMGFVGVGSRGTGLLKQMLIHPEVEVLAICDIDESHLNAALGIVEKARENALKDFPRDLRISNALWYATTWTPYWLPLLPSSTLRLL